MLSLRTAPKKDLQSSSAELVYGQPLWVPGDFHPTNSTSWWSLIGWATLLKYTKVFSPLPTSLHGFSHSYVPGRLYTADYVFICHDAHRGSLQLLYDGPFRVLMPREKHFVVEIGGRLEQVSVDRLKPAHVHLDKPVSLAEPRQRGRPPRRALGPEVGPVTLPCTSRASDSTSVDETEATPVYCGRFYCVVRPPVL